MVGTCCEECSGIRCLDCCFRTREHLGSQLSYDQYPEYNDESYTRTCCGVILVPTIATVLVRRALLYQVVICSDDSRRAFGRHRTPLEKLTCSIYPTNP